MDNQLNKILKASISEPRPVTAPEEVLCFQSNGLLTLGVEIELQLIDSESYNLSSKANDVLDATAHLQKIKPEFYLSTIEINTDKCISTQEVEEDLYETLNQLQIATKDLGILYSTTGSHPFSKFADWVVSPSTRCQEIIDRNQWLTKRMSVFGLHVHLGMASGEECIRFNNFFINFLPHLLALSSSSPFWQGIDTGLASCRPTTYEALPTAGQPYHVRTWKDFEQLYKSLKLCGSIRSLRDLWWDLRPNSVFGTLEIRVCDGAATLAETLAIVAFIHTLAHWFVNNGSWLENVAYPPSWLSRENKWRAMRYGLDAELVKNTEGKTKCIREDISEWLDILQPYINQLGYETYFSTLKMIMNSGTSSERQRKIFESNQSLIDIVKHNVSEFLLQVPLYRRESVLV